MVGICGFGKKPIQRSAPQRLVKVYFLSSLTTSSASTVSTSSACFGSELAPSPSELVLLVRQLSFVELFCKDCMICMILSLGAERFDVSIAVFGTALASAVAPSSSDFLSSESCHPCRRSAYLLGDNVIKFVASFSTCRELRPQQRSHLSFSTSSLSRPRTGNSDLLFCALVLALTFSMPFASSSSR